MGRKGQVMGEETINRMRQNNARYWKGKNMSIESNKKRSNSLKAKSDVISNNTKRLWENPEYRKMMSEKHKGQKSWNKGRKETRPEVLEKQSKSHIGRIPWNKGLTITDERVKKYARKKGEFKHTKETKEKLSKIHAGKRFSPNTEFKNGQVAPMKGKKLSENRRKQISYYMKGRYIGENSPRWKGGISKINKLVRHMPEYLQWRSDVFQRDNWTCQTCGDKGCYLEAHHRYELFRIIEEEGINNILDARKCDRVWDINNGVTLCRPCHNLTKHGKTLK